MQTHIFISTVSDGSMKSVLNNHNVARRNRIRFLDKQLIPPSETTLHTLSYTGDDYCRYKIVDTTTKGDGIVRHATIDADAVVTITPNHAILLPLADCVGAVIYHPIKNILMVSHLGRHNLEQFGGTKCIQYLIDQYSITPSELIVQLSPSAGSDAYPLFAFNNRSLQDVAIEQITAAGVLSANITPSTIDTTKNRKYFSHSEFLKGNRKTDGRFAIVAVLR
ncbi:laccase domain-containing protein [Candidatus Saccharibacteria bacterium]|nr:laccase domain-containing protein [Candidatus Saccharibacteria bacterium]